jgi:hypothetical protein
MSSSNSNPTTSDYQGSDPDVIEIQLDGLIRSQQDWIHGRAYRDLTKDEFITAMGLKYSFLNKASAKLFNKAANGELATPQARTQINQILIMLKQVAAGRLKQQEADVIFGKQQAAKYVDPLVEKLNKTSPNDK